MGAKFAAGRLTIRGRSRDELAFEEANVGADVVMAAEAELAVVAVERGLKRSAIARGRASDAFAGLDDDARGLVPEHHGIGIGHAADLALAVGMQVGAADADGFDADTGLRPVRDPRWAFR